MWFIILVILVLDLIVEVDERELINEGWEDDN
jgi:hypothetical protein